MAYSAKCRGNLNGTYTLSYGKGSKKLVSQLYHDKGEWITDQSKEKLKRDAVSEWEKWAASVYNSGSAPDPDSDNPTNDPTHTEEADAPTTPIGVNDELSEYDRTLLENAAKHQGPLDEWTRSMLRNLLKRLTSAFESKIVTKPLRISGPPRFVVKDTEDAAPEIPSPDAESDTGANSSPIRSEIQDSGEESGAHGTGSVG
jgi:hypothetical protein